VLENKADIANHVATDGIRPTVHSWEMLEVTAASDPQHDLRSLVHHLPASGFLFKHYVTFLITLAIEDNDVTQARVFHENTRLRERLSVAIGNPDNASIVEIGGHVYLMSSRTFSAT
jgi:hypothetical protein